MGRAGAGRLAAELLMPVAGAVVTAAVVVAASGPRGRRGRWPAAGPLVPVGRRGRPAPSDG
ncbi:hypothetical protein [Streptomyces collinus]|uniref:Uncharacterized protein n=1 Tax=Streptomyces collinus (strain DSM 40733 / Tue 365) TaxID=1214242 RepID=S5VLW2_STRC3|nr:hypothetical protein [Streptomyces collinus]AGS71542.1 hypothetical protein B446_23650 [Streptomyces collinus Tu 365]